MGMTKNCQNCAEKCPQAELANQEALGRMYATKEFIALQKKVESGELVEVVRCKDCKNYRPPFCLINDNKQGWLSHVLPEHFCAYGEREG